VAELVFYCGTMDCGKSTLALQIDHNYRARGRAGLIFTRLDRAGRSVLSSRLGLATPAREVTPELDFWDELVAHLTAGHAADHLICDEAQFYTPTQVEQLARVVDELGLDVHAFGITSDFRTELFPGSKRLVELADRVQVLQVEALCWCGRRATHNARVVDGVMVVEGEQVVVGDTGDPDAVGGPSGDDPAERGGVEYEVLCRRHHVRRMTSAIARASVGTTQTLPFDLGGPGLPGSGLPGSGLRLGPRRGAAGGLGAEDDVVPARHAGPTAPPAAPR
jgi:thymidine kinase